MLIDSVHYVYFFRCGTIKPTTYWPIVRFQLSSITAVSLIRIAAAKQLQWMKQEYEESVSLSSALILFYYKKFPLFCLLAIFCQVYHARPNRKEGPFGKDCCLRGRFCF